MKEKEMPLLVKVLAILSFIEAGFAVLGSILFLIFGIIFLVAPPQLSGEDLASLQAAGLNLSDGFFGAIGIVLLVLSVIVFGIAALNFFVGRGLWRGSNWARIFTIIVSFIAVLFSILGMFQPPVTAGNIVSNLIGILIMGAIGFYFLLNEKVKRAFSV